MQTHRLHEQTKRNPKLLLQIKRGNSGEALSTHRSMSDVFSVAHRTITHSHNIRFIGQYVNAFENQALSIHVTQPSHICVTTRREAKHSKKSRARMEQTSGSVVEPAADGSWMVAEREKQARAVGKKVSTSDA